MSYMYTRLKNSNNYNQGLTTRVLCICSAGLLRSPTMAHILSAEPFNFNTRSVGAESAYALIPLDKVHVSWADVIICVDGGHMTHVKRLMDEIPSDNGLPEKRLITLDCPDRYEYRDPRLVSYLTDKLLGLFPEDIRC